MSACAKCGALKLAEWPCPQCGAIDNKKERAADHVGISWAEVCPACKGYPDEPHRMDATCLEQLP